MRAKSARSISGIQLREKILDVLENVALQGELLNELKTFITNANRNTTEKASDVAKKKLCQCVQAIGLGWPNDVRRMDFYNEYLCQVVEQMSADTLSTDDDDTKQLKTAWCVESRASLRHATPPCL